MNKADTLSEAAVLGTLLLCPEEIPQARVELRAEDFLRVSYRDVFKAFTDLDESNGAVDLPSVVRHLINSKKRKDVRETTAEMVALIDTVAATTMLSHHIGIVQEQSKLRAIGYLAKELSVATASRDNSLATELVGQLHKLQHVDRLPEAVTMTKAALQHAEWHYKLETQKLQKYRTGIDLFDGKVNSLYKSGMMQGQLGIIGGRTGAGKTTIATWLATQIAINNKAQRVHIFSLELKPEHLAAKSIQMQVKRDSIKANSQSDEAKTAAYLMSGWADRVTISEEREPRRIFQRARKMAKEGVTMFVLDHLHRIKLEDPRGSTARFEYGEFCRDVTDIAKDDGALWLLAAQFNREAAKTNRPPLLGDLCESAMIEQHSDFVVGIHYPNPHARSAIQLVLLKNRWGDSNCSQSLTVDWKAQSIA